MSKQLWTLSIVTVLLLIVGSGLGQAIPSLGGPTGIVALPTADIAPQDFLDIVLSRQSIQMGNEDLTNWEFNALGAVSSRAELWIAHSKVKDEFDSRVWGLGGKYQLKSYEDGRTAVAVGAGWLNWTDGLITWVRQLPRATQEKWADSTPADIRPEVRELFGFKAAHAVSVTAKCTPSTILPGGTSLLEATATCNQGHQIASGLWSDGDAGGEFDDASAAVTAYTPPADFVGTITLTAEATCDGTPSATGRASCSLTVSETAEHAVGVVIQSSAPTIYAGGTVTLTAEVVDTYGHTVTGDWSDGAAGGVFSAPTSSLSTNYTAPPTLEGVTQITITFEATCDWDPPAMASDTLALIVAPHTVEVTATCTPDTIGPGGEVSLSAGAECNQGHDIEILSWLWSDGGKGGDFQDQHSPVTAYRPPADYVGAITLTAEASCNGTLPVTGTGSCDLTVSETPVKHQVVVNVWSNTYIIGPGGSVVLEASAADTLGHPIATRLWSDGVVGGLFSDPDELWTTYTAPTSLEGVTQITITFEAECSEGASDSDWKSLRVSSSKDDHVLSVVSWCWPTELPATGGEVFVSADCVDNQGWGVATWTWTEPSGAGTFENANSKMTTFTVNETTAARTIDLTVTAVSLAEDAKSVPSSCSLTQQAAGHQLTVTATATPGQLNQDGGDVTLTATFDDNQDYDVAAWSWTATPSGAGSFADPTDPTTTFLVNAWGMYLEDERDICFTATATSAAPDALEASGQACVIQMYEAPGLPTGPVLRLSGNRLAAPEGRASLAELKRSFTSPATASAQSSYPPLNINRNTSDVLAYLRSQDVAVRNAYLVVTRDLSPNAPAAEEGDAGPRLLGSMGLFYLKADPDVGRGWSLTRPFVGLQYLGTGGNGLAIEYRWKDCTLDRQALFSAVFRQLVSESFTAEFGTTNSSPIGLGLSDQDWFLRVAYRLPLK